MSQETQERLLKALEGDDKSKIAQAAFEHGEEIGRTSTPAPEMSGPELYAIWRNVLLMNAETADEWDDLDSVEQIAWENAARTAAGQLRSGPMRAR